MAWDHKGWTITLREDHGDFVAEIPGSKRITGPSLAAVKAKIDKTSSFEAFDAILERHGEIKEHRIVGVAKARGRYRSDQWLTSTGLELAVIVRDTPENRARMAALVKTRSKVHEQIERLRQEVADLDDAILHERPPSA